MTQYLELHPNVLYVWKRQQEQHTEKAFSDKGNPADQEMVRLQKENARLKVEVEILKKATGIFPDRFGRDSL